MNKSPNPFLLTQPYSSTSHSLTVNTAAPDIYYVTIRRQVPVSERTTWRLSEWHARIFPLTCFPVTTMLCCWITPCIKSLAKIVKRWQRLSQASVIITELLVTKSRSGFDERNHHLICVVSCVFSPSFPTSLFLCYLYLLLMVMQHCTSGRVQRIRWWF